MIIYIYIYYFNKINIRKIEIEIYQLVTHAIPRVFNVREVVSVMYFSTKEGVSVMYVILDIIIYF